MGARVASERAVGKMTIPTAEAPGRGCTSVLSVACIALIFPLMLPLSPAAAQVTFTNTACLELGGLKSCEDLADPRICEAIRGRFCRGLERCDLEVAAMPNLGGDDDVFIVRGHCPDAWLDFCNGLVRRPASGQPSVVTGPTPDPDWDSTIGKHFSVEGGRVLSELHILERLDDLLPDYGSSYSPGSSFLDPANLGSILNSGSPDGVVLDPGSPGSILGSGSLDSMTEVSPLQALQAMQAAEMIRGSTDNVVLSEIGSAGSSDLGLIGQARPLAMPLNRVSEWAWSALVSAGGGGPLDLTVESPVRIALIDSGISHLAFERIKALGVGISEGLATHPLVEHLSVVVPSARLGTLHSHGTTMAGTIARTLHHFLPDPSGIELVIYRGFDKKCAPAVGVVKAIEDAIARKSELIVIAAEMANGNPKLKAAIEAAVQAGSLVLVGAPNENIELTAQAPYFPASWNREGLVVVSSIDTSEEAVDAYSQEAVDLHAPGRGVPTLDLGGHDVWSKGSSLATALVSAVAAMTLAQLPQDFVPRDLEALLIDGVRKLADLDGKSRSGGVIDLRECVELARARSEEEDPTN